MKEDGFYDGIEDLCILLVVWSSSIKKEFEQGKKRFLTRAPN